MFAFHQKSGKRRLIDEVLDVLQPTLGAAFGELHTGEEGAAPFRAALSGAANLCFVPIMLDGMAVRSRARTLRRVAAMACRSGRHRRVASHRSS